MLLCTTMLVLHLYVLSSQNNTFFTISLHFSLTIFQNLILGCYNVLLFNIYKNNKFIKFIQGQFSNVMKLHVIIIFLFEFLKENTFLKNILSAIISTRILKLILPKESF